MSSVLCARLANGVLLPAISFGTWRLRDGEEHTIPSISSALSVGYRGVDTAYRYRNEKSVGQAVQSWQAELTNEAAEIENIGSLIKVTADEFEKSFAHPHGELTDARKVFVATKIWVSHYTPQGIRESINEHLRHMGRDVADLVSFHWSGEHVDNDPNWGEAMLSPLLPEKRRVCWQALEKMYAAKLVRAIGVSNYALKHLKGIVEDVETRQALGDTNAVKPMYNQIEISPYCPPCPEMLEYCTQHKIQLASYSTLGSRVKSASLTNEPIILALAHKHGKTPSQIILRWALQQNIVVLPRSTNRQHQIDNLNVYGFHLSPSDMEEISKLKDYSKRVCPDPFLVA